MKHQTEVYSRTLFTQSVHTFLSNSGSETLNDDLADIPVFHNENIHIVSKLGKKLVEAKAA